MIKGLDLTADCKIEDFGKIRRDGYDFVYLDAGNGNRPEPHFAECAQSASSAGLLTGALWRSRASGMEEAKQEAAQLIKQLTQCKEFLVLPAALDFSDKSLGGLTVSECLFSCSAFCAAVTEAGFRVMLLSSSEWLQNRLSGASLNEIPRWVIHMGVEKPHCTRPWFCWRYSEVKSAYGNMHLNYAREELFGQSDGWITIEGRRHWYENGLLRCDSWIKDGGFQYRLDGMGNPQTGWQRIKGKRYYLNEHPMDGLPAGALAVTDEAGALKEKGKPQGLMS